MTRLHRVAAPIFVCFVLESHSSPAAQELADEAAIRALIESHAVVWNKRDIQAASDVYADNAIIATASGQVYAGRSGVEKWHTGALAGPNPIPHTHPADTARIYVVRSDVAVAEVESHSAGPTAADGQPAPMRKAPLFTVLVKASDGWRIAAQRPTTLPVK